MGAGSADHVYYNVGKHGSDAYYSSFTDEDLNCYFGWAGATGWKMMMILNLGTAPNPMIASEAKYIEDYYGNQDPTFEIGNEPDLYTSNSIRPAHYGFELLKNEFNDRYLAVKAAVPNAIFTGPSTSGTGWIAPFLEKESSQLAAVTGHFYQLEVGSDSVVTINKLLHSNADTSAWRTNLPPLPASITFLTLSTRPAPSIVPLMA